MEASWQDALQNLVRRLQAVHQDAFRTGDQDLHMQGVSQLTAQALQVCLAAEGTVSSKATQLPQ